MKRFWDALCKMQRLGLVGDAGLGAVVAVLACIALTVVGGFEQAVYGAPKVLIYGAGLGLGAMLISHAAGWMPEVERDLTKDS